MNDRPWELVWRCSEGLLKAQIGYGRFIHSVVSRRAALSSPDLIAAPQRALPPRPGSGRWR